jgi:hypothetical protein
MRRSIALLLMMLGACSPLIGLNNGLENINGHPVKEAFAKLGLPDSEGVVAGKKFYIYESGSKAVDFEGNMAPNCKIRLIVDENEVIRAYNYAGNLSGCWYYSSRL